MQLFNSKSQTAAKFAALVALSAALAPVSAQDAIIASIANQISQDIVAARSSDIPLSQASSEVSSFIAAITGNADMNNLFKSLFNVAANGVNSNNLVEFAQQAASSLMAYSDSPQFTSLQGIIAANTGNYDLDQITSNLDDSFEPMLAQITPQVTALEVSDYDANFEDAMNDLYYAALNVGYGAIYGAQGNEYTAEDGSTDGSTDESTDGSTDGSIGELPAAQLVGAGSIHFAAGTIPFAAAASASSFFMNMKGSTSSIKARGTTTRSGRTTTITALAARSTESAAETTTVSSLSSSASEDVSSAVETVSSATTESSSELVSSASSVASSSSASSSSAASSSAAASSAAATSSQAQPGDANSRAVTGAFLMGGAVIAVANYLL